LLDVLSTISLSRNRSLPESEPRGDNADMVSRSGHRKSQLVIPLRHPVTTLCSPTAVGAVVVRVWRRRGRCGRGRMASPVTKHHVALPRMLRAGRIGGFEDAAAQ
jgi:hypothetical protein